MQTTNIMVDNLKMSDKNTKIKEEKVKKPVQILRERHGGVSKQLKERVSEQTKIRKKIAEALRDKPRTVPEISEISGIPAHKVLFYLMGMKKYGEVIEGEERDDYYEYALKEEKKQEKDK